MTNNLFGPSVLLPIALLACLSFAPAAALADQPSATQGITVTGECLVKVPQDRGAVTVTSSVVSPDARKAADDAIARHERAKAQVAALGLKDSSRQTLSMTVSEEWDWRNNQRVSLGYRATTATRFETADIPRLGDIIAAASKVESQQVSGLETFASPSTMKAAREGCLETATKNAALKAEKIAAGAGVSLGKVILISEESREPERPMPFARRAAVAEAAAASDAPSIDTQAEDLQVTVTAAYAIN